MELGANPGRLRIPRLVEELRVGSVDLLSARIDLTESGMFEEVWTWSEIYDTDLVEEGEFEGD